MNDHDDLGQADLFENVSAVPETPEPAPKKARKKAEGQAPDPAGQALPQAKAPDPVDLDDLLLRGGASPGVRKLLSHVPVRKPNKAHFIRTHSDPAYWADFYIVEDKENNEVYVATQKVMADLAYYEIGRKATLALGITRQGHVFLWPLRISDGKTDAWLQTERKAADKAKHVWLRCVSDMSLGGYVQFIAEGDDATTPPEWPKESMAEIIRIAFGSGSVVDSLDHPAVKGKLGRRQDI